MRWVLLAVLLLTLPVFATDFRHGNTLIIPSDEVIKDDLIVSGGTVRVLGKVTGDLIVAGGTVDAFGPVGGDLIAAGGTVDVRGPVTGSVIAAAGTLDLNAEVGRNLTAAGGTLLINAGTRVARDLSLCGGDATVSATVGRNLLIQTRAMHLTNSTHVAGNMTAMTNHPEIASGAVILGQRTITPFPHQFAARKSFAARALMKVFMGIALLLAGIVFVAIAPRLTGETQTAILQHPGGSLLAGLVILLIGVPLFILLCITLIGIPLALIWLWIYGTALFLSPIFLAIIAGRAILRRPADHGYLALLIGVALLVVARLIPVIGFLVILAAVLFGLGGLTLALQNRTAHHPAPPPAPAEAAA